MILQLFLLFSLALTSPLRAETVRIAVTTSFHNSGLHDVLLPALEADTGIDVQLLVVGTGQALRLGRAGDVDALLVHAPPLEAAFVAEGFAPYRLPVMQNDFVIAGPLDDPAGVQATTNTVDAFARILGVGEEGEAAFVSRGDDSGTHAAELAIWRDADLVPNGRWYKSVGAGMGAALNVASGLGGYVLTDRASWLAFGNREGLRILHEGDPVLHNPYAYLPISAERHPHVARDAAERVGAWLVSDRARALIDGYRIDGARLFAPAPRP